MTNTKRTNYPIRYCTGGCADPNHHPHVYNVDPVDGPLHETKLCPGNAGPRVREWLDDDGTPSGIGFIDLEAPIEAPRELENDHVLEVLRGEHDETITEMGFKTREEAADYLRKELKARGLTWRP